MTRSLQRPQVLLGFLIPAAVLAIGAAAVLLWRHRRKTHQGLLGAVLPPGPGPDTTLLVTDIQSSTQLWEVLPSQVRCRDGLVSAAVATCHATGGGSSRLCFFDVRVTCQQEPCCVLCALVLLLHHSHLHSQVMDTALQLHHGVFRQMLKKYKGYESCTEVGR